MAVQVLILKPYWNQCPTISDDAPLQFILYLRRWGEGGGGGTNKRVHCPFTVSMQRGWSEVQKGGHCSLIRQCAYVLFWNFYENKFKKFDSDHEWIRVWIGLD